MFDYIYFFVIINAPFKFKCDYLNFHTHVIE